MGFKSFNDGWFPKVAYLIICGMEDVSKSTRDVHSETMNIAR